MYCSTRTNSNEVPGQGRRHEGRGRCERVTAFPKLRSDKGWLVFFVLPRPEISTVRYGYTRKHANRVTWARRSNQRFLGARPCESPWRAGNQVQVQVQVQVLLSLQDVSHLCQPQSWSAQTKRSSYLSYRKHDVGVEMQISCKLCISAGSRPRWERVSLSPPLFLEILTVENSGSRTTYGWQSTIGLFRPYARCCAVAVLVRGAGDSTRTTRISRGR